MPRRKKQSKRVRCVWGVLRVVERPTAHRGFATKILGG